MAVYPCGHIAHSWDAGVCYRCASAGRLASPGEKRAARKYARAVRKTRRFATYEVGQPDRVYGAQEPTHGEAPLREQPVPKGSQPTQKPSQAGPTAQSAPRILGGACARCGGAMKVGESLQFDHTNTGQWAHARCVATQEG